MKNSRIKYVLLVSLLLNFSFLGAAGYTHYRQTRDRAAPYGYGIHGLAPVCSSNQPYLFEALSLKPEQRKLFEQKAPLFHDALNEKEAKVNRLRESLFALMRSDHPDSAAVETTIADINRTQQDIQKLIVAHMLEFKSMLDKEQQKKFFDLIQGAMTKMHEIEG
jgi:Spy/CpxP family protein refolding chaperone